MSTAAVVARGAGAGLGLKGSLSRNRRWALIASYFFLVLFAIFFLIPPYYMIVTAFKSDAEVAHMATNPWIIADGVTLDQFRILLTQTDFLRFFRNTAIVTLCVVAITMVVSAADKAESTFESLLTGWRLFPIMRPIARIAGKTAPGGHR